MMNRTVRTKLPALIKPPRNELHLTAQANDRAAKAKHKEYGDKHRRAKHTEVGVGDSSDQAEQDNYQASMGPGTLRSHGGEGYSGDSQEGEQAENQEHGEVEGGQGET